MPPRHFKLSPFSQRHLQKAYNLFSRRHFGKTVIPFQKFVEVYNLLNLPNSSFLNTSKKAQIGRQVVRNIASHLRINQKRKVALTTSQTHLDRQWPESAVSEYFRLRRSGMGVIPSANKLGKSDASAISLERRNLTDRERRALEHIARSKSGRVFDRSEAYFLLKQINAEGNFVFNASAIAKACGISRIVVNSTNKEHKIRSHEDTLHILRPNKERNTRRILEEAKFLLLSNFAKRREKLKLTLLPMLAKQNRTKGIMLSSGQPLLQEQWKAIFWLVKQKGEPVLIKDFIKGSGVKVLDFQPLIESIIQIEGVQVVKVKLPFISILPSIISFS